MVKVALHFAQGALHVLDEMMAGAGQAAHGRDGFALSVVIGDDEDFAIIAQAMSGAFDDLIGGLARFRKEDFDLGSGVYFGSAEGSACAIEDDGERSTGGVLVLGQPMDEFVTG